MPDQPSFDLQAAHRHFSTECFNRAWDLIEKPMRSAGDDEEMLRLAVASLWHWSQRTDFDSTHRSVGCWQVSRVYSLLGQAENARRYASLCLAASQSGSMAPFYLAYAYEALARAEMVGGKREAMQNYLHQARLVTERMRDMEDKELVLKDLETIR